MNAKGAAPQPMLAEMLERDLGRGTGDLPLLPRGAREALRLAQLPDVNLNDVAHMAEADPPLTARILSVANSALYSRGEKQTSVKRALVRIGTQATRDLLYQTVYAAMLFDVPGYKELVEATFVHGVAVARIARRLAPLRGIDPDTSFLAGLLHDVGRARCWKLVSRRARNLANLAEAAAAVDTLHTRAGAELAAAWRLPDEVVQACDGHHRPFGRPMAQHIAVADTLGRRVEPEPRATDEDVRAVLTEAAMGIERLAELLEMATQESTLAAAVG